jgi:arylsulfatase A
MIKLTQRFLEFLLFLFCGIIGSHAAQRPNILLINADDLGINDLHCYGRAEHTTPNLDKLAEQGLRFTSAYCAQPICSPSRAALLTGKHPARLHITTFLPGRKDAPTQKLLHPEIKQALPLEETTLAEVLRDAGYDTAIVGKWHLGNVKQFAPDKQGFNTVYTGKAKTEPSDTEGSKGEFDLARAACEFITKERTTPFFLYLAHNTPHIAYAARPGKLQEKTADGKPIWNPEYADVIAAMDESVGVVLKKLDELKLADNTIVVFISDNGGLHVPEGDVTKTPATHNTPYRAGKGYLYEGGLRVPLIVRWPGKIKSKVVSRSFNSIDLMPTLLSLVNIDVKGIEFDGSSHGPEFLGEQPFADSKLLFWHFPHYNNQGGRPGCALRMNAYKYIEYYDTGEIELYELLDDPSETTNIAGKNSNICNAMKNRAVEFRKRLGVQENTPNPDYDQTAADKIYKEFDTSKIPLRATAAETAAEFKVWRERMNAAVAGQKRSAKAKDE